MKTQALPNISPDYCLDFEKTGRVSPNLNVARTSTATSKNPDNSLRVLSAGQPRIVYESGNPVGWGAEGENTNYCADSNFNAVKSSLQQGYWYANTMTVEVGIATKYDVSASKKITNTATTQPFLQYHSTLAPGIATATVNVKRGTQGKYAALYLCPSLASVTGIGLIFNFDTGQIEKIDRIPEDSTSIATFNACYATALDDGWYQLRISVNFKASASDVCTMVINAGNHYPGVVGDNIYVSNCQLEPNITPKSYIPTAGGGAVAMKVKEYASLGNFPFQDSGTIVIDFTLQSAVNFMGFLFTFEEGTRGPYYKALGLYYNENARQFNLYRNNPENNFGCTIYNYTGLGRKKMAFSFSNKRLAAAVNGKFVSSNAMDLTATNNYDRGTLAAPSGGFFDTHAIFHSFRFYKSVVSDAQLAELSK